MEETLSSVEASLKARILQRKRERNNLIPFNQLPLEIASNILWLSISDPWKRKITYSFLQRLGTISSVCSSWRALVEGSPRFWSTIEFRAPRQTILTQLEKSKSSPLEIKCFSDGAYHCAPTVGRGIGVVLVPQLRLIESHTHRIRSLIVSMPTTNGMITLLDKPAPMLEELRLTFVHCMFVEPLELFCGQAGRLKDVALENLPVRWDSKALVGLRSLSIKGLACSSTKVQAVRLLEANPDLEKLDLEDLVVMEGFGDDDVPSAGGERIRVLMRKMRELRLFSLPFDLVRVVLGAIAIPSIQTFNLKCLFRGQPASRLFGPNIKHLVPPLLNRSRGTELAEIKLGKASLGLSIHLPRHKTPPIEIQLSNTETPVAGFEWLAENLFSSQNGLPTVGSGGAEEEGKEEMFQVSLGFGENFDMEVGSFVPILHQLSTVRVKTLTIDSACRGERLIKYLGKKKEGLQWPLPHLMSLTVAGYAYNTMASDLLTALQRRKSAAPSEGTAAPQSAVHLPAPLEILDIGGLRGLDHKTQKALADCISKSGTFTRPSRQQRTYWDGNGEGWEDLDDDNGYDEDIYNTYGPLAMVSPYVW